MKRAALVVAAFFTVTVVFTSTALAQEQPKQAAVRDARPVPQTPEWQKLSSLVGEWEGTFEEAGQTMPSRVEVRMTADGSAIMHLMGSGTPFEMVTMFHPDGSRLLATHYCAEHNQPRMALVPSQAPNELAFDFVDGTNIQPGDAHMRPIVITFKDADHHDEAWTARMKDGKEGTALFRFTRKK